MASDIVDRLSDQNLATLSADGTFNLCPEAKREIQRLRFLIENIETTWINGDCGEVEVDSAIAQAVQAAKPTS